MELLDAPKGAEDIFAISDDALSEKLQFIEEIGFGNWGSVWLCKPKQNPDSPTADALARLQPSKIAVKLVHRSQTPTTAARMKSLWNEMKIVREFKHDPHPSIVPFHSYVITPSYALITMAYLPTLVPVEVDEPVAKKWFWSLLSGVQFLHARGVVHNDIKPANILLSHKNIPVLVDFGFAQKYDVKSSKAFHSNLAYGTPEYLSPERARGLPHDTRKSDVWSLGVTFFEILVGRTPFEHSDGEQFTSKEDLELYWARTLKGKWVGEWKMSKGVERMLRRMLSPNADLRYTAKQTITDPYWDGAHRRSQSYGSSIIFEKDLGKLAATEAALPTMPETPASPPGLDAPAHRTKERVITKTKSQPKVAATSSSSLRGQTGTRKRAPPMPAIEGSPAPAAMAASSRQHKKENSVVLSSPLTTKETASKARRPLGVLSPVGARANTANLPKPPTRPKDVVKENLRERERYRGQALAELTGHGENRRRPHGRDVVKDDGAESRTHQGKKESWASARVREWEREKERLREMERLEELEKERDDEREIMELAQRAEKVARRVMEASREEKERLEKAKQEKEKPSGDSDKENRGEGKNGFDPSSVASRASTLAMGAIDAAMVQQQSESSSPKAGSSNDSALIGLKHGFKASIDKTVRLYKSSTLGHLATGRNTPANLSVDCLQDNAAKRDSWEDLSLASSTLPAVHQAAQNERVGADNKMDRMTIWVRNVEKVVADARQEFASSSKGNEPLPPLPLAPLSRSDSAPRVRVYGSNRLPRRTPASQIFSDDGYSPSPTASSFVMSAFPSPNTSAAVYADMSAVQTGSSPLLSSPAPQTPSRQRRATVSTRSPEPIEKNKEEDVLDLTGSPSKRKEKSRSHGNLFQSKITPVAVLEQSLQIYDAPPQSKRLSAVVDRSLFIRTPSTPASLNEEADLPAIVVSPVEQSFGELTSSPVQVEPYPARKATSLDIPDTPSQRRLESVYDRFLMATSGVKRVGKGYQSQVYNTNSPAVASYKRNSRVFHSTRHNMPPPVSSEAFHQRQAVSVDELGMMNFAEPATPSAVRDKDDGNTTVAHMRRALKAIVPGKTISRRLSRMG